jgi:hypothetical protein
MNTTDLEKELKKTFEPIYHPRGRLIATAEYKGCEIHETADGKFTYKIGRLLKEAATLVEVTAAIDKYIQNAST